MMMSPLPSQPVRIAKTDSFGGKGGSEYQPSKKIQFSPNLRIAKINMRSGNAVDCIQFVMTDGMQFYELEKMGGNGGKASEFVVPQGQYITEIIVYHQPYCEGLQFKTNAGLTSQLFGKGKGSQAVVPINGNLIAYGGRCGSNIDAIQFYYTC